jgi:hypothetical protein
MFYSDYADSNACPAFDEDDVRPYFDPSLQAFKGIIYAVIASGFLWLGILLLLKWLF